MMSPAEKSANPTKVRFGIAGFGHHAVRRLMPGAARAERSVVTALSRRDAEKGRISAREYGIPHAFTTTAELCRCPEVDAIFVASPDALHEADVMECIRAGKPVLCEKPMGMNAAECERMAEAARDAGVLLGVAHNFRFEESTRRFRQQVMSGALGRPVVARAEFYYPGQSSPRVWINDPTLACGGPIGDVGVHCIDALRFVLQDEVVAVTATVKQDAESGAVESGAVLGLEFSKGTLGVVVVSTRTPYHTDLEISGDLALLSAPDAFGVDVPVEIEFRPYSGPGSTQRETVSNELCYAYQFDAFADAVRGEAVFPCSAEDGLRNQLVLDAAYRSWRSGKREMVG